MTVGTAFIRGFNPIWSLVDLNGLQLDDTYWLWTLQNTIPYVPQAVYTDPAGLIPYTDPVQFLANGTLPNNLYWDDTKVYRLEIRQHVGLGPPTQADPLIYLVENYIPNGTGITPGSTEGIVTDNQISNGQFAIVNFTTPLLLNINNPVAQVIPIAPDWSIVLGGVGTATITQVPLNTTNSNPTNAPFALQITLNGVWTSSPYLQQIFEVNGQNWQNKYLANSITGMIVGPQQQIRIQIAASNGATVASFMSPLLTNNFTQFVDNEFVNPFVNLDLPPAAYMVYKILLPYIADIYLTSVQMVVSDTSQNYSYEQDTIDRQLDHLAHYYMPLIAAKPIPSYLVGWDFPMNPKQFGSTYASFASGINSSNYAWDQTIVYQSLATGVAVAPASDGSLTLTANHNNSQFAIIQYLEASQAVELLTGPISVYLAALATAATNVTISLFYTAGSALPNMNTNNSLVLTLDANGGVATFNNPTGGTWTQVPNGNLGPVQFTIAPSATYQQFSTNIPFQITDGSYSTATFFAIVIGFSPVASGKSVTIQSVGVNAGSIPTAPAPQSYQQTLTDCEYYYEKSYGTGVAIGTNTQVNMMTASMGIYLDGVGNSEINPSPFTLQYRTLKRIPTVIGILYSPTTGVAHTVDTYVEQQYINFTAGPSTITSTTYWNYLGGDKSAFFNVIAVGPNGGPYQIGTVTLGSAMIFYHYSIDARLGIV